MQKEAHPSYKLQEHAYEWRNPYKLKEDNPHKEIAEIYQVSEFFSNKVRISAEFDSKKYSYQTILKTSSAVKAKLWIVVCFKFIEFFS